MVEVNIREAKTHLSRLLRRVAAGEDVLIKKRGKPLARLVRLEEARAERPLGIDEGRFEVPDDFDAPLPDAILEAFEGNS